MIIPVGHPKDLPALVEDVRIARAVLHQERNVLGGGKAARAAQRELFDCLTAFTAALTARGLPVPYAVHAELRMYDGVLTAYPL
jgi:hypothetical protein